MSDKRRLWLGGLLVLLVAMPCLVLARQQIEASTVVTGSIVVKADGSVSSYTLDHPEKLSKGIVSVLARNVPQWKFRPYVVDGRPVAAQSHMSVRLVARKAAHGDYTVAVRGATFSAGSTAGSSGLKVQRVPPKYPQAALRDRVSGSVYLVVQVNHQGKAEDVAAQQVNLGLLGSDRDMKYWRKLLADASTTAVRKWTFNPPAPVFPATQRYWYARVPIIFSLDVDGVSTRVAYGRWQSYVPGPVNLIPWLDQRQLAAGSPDAMPAGAIHSLDGAGLQLKTSLDGG